MLNPQLIKKQFPIFDRKVNGKTLVYLDNASTSQKPQVVLEALANYYTTKNANIHRGVHTLSEIATQAYEATREKTATFINARESAEIIFTRNATEAFNLVAYTWGEQNIKAGDEIVVSELEHHSNLIPWQQLVQKKGAKLKIIPLNNKDDQGTAAELGELDLSRLSEIITPKCKLVAVTQMSNVLGTRVNLPLIILAAREAGAKVMVDAAQGIAHMGVDVQELDCDFLAFSAHKMFGPTGVGVLYGKRELLETMPPFLFGGDMVKEVGQFEANWNEIPWKFEAGTPNIADVIAFSAAIDFLKTFDFEDIRRHDEELTDYARQKLSAFPGIVLFGGPTSAGILSFHIPGVHPHDVASILNESGVAVRAGHHCAQPLMRRLQIPATSRMSFSVYNDQSDVDAACEAVKDVYKVFKI